MGISQVNWMWNRMCKGKCCLSWQTCNVYRSSHAFKITNRSRVRTAYELLCSDIYPLISCRLVRGRW